MDIGESQSGLYDITTQNGTLSVPPSGEVWKFTQVGAGTDSGPNNNISVGIDDGTNRIIVAQSNSGSPPISNASNGDGDINADGARSITIDGDHAKLAYYDDFLDAPTLFWSATRVA